MDVLQDIAYVYLIFRLLNGLVLVSEVSSLNCNLIALMLGSLRETLATVHQELASG